MEDKVKEFETELLREEKKQNTVKQYLKYINDFIEYANIERKEDITKEKLIEYKEHLKEVHKKESSINIKIIIINKFIAFIGLPEKYKLKQIKTQRKTNLENVLNEKEYQRLLEWAMKLNKITMYYLMRTLAGTGIRISELQYITVEAVKKGEAVFDSKGTVERKAFINKKLQKELLKYCKEEGIKTGIIFKSRNGNPLDSAYIYKEIQWIAGQARIKKSKAHPHSFRHLFAKNYLSKPGHNIADLKNILGHKNISTTEIYLQKSTRELKETLED